ncbi:hypothetical protein PF008_g14081 [Phytophthora fragariae]|nr:hypothetical protein PF008_g14081 [Phytophthora fragariae]
MRFSYVVVLVATALVGCTSTSTASKATGIARDFPLVILSSANNDKFASGV